MFPADFTRHGSSSHALQCNSELWISFLSNLCLSPLSLLVGCSRKGKVGTQGDWASAKTLSALPLTPRPSFYPLETGPDRRNVFSNFASNQAHTTTMDDPGTSVIRFSLLQDSRILMIGPAVAEIALVIETLCTASPAVQRAAIETYFTTTASFTHPFCRTGSFAGSIWLIIMIYRWYKILSPHIDVGVDSIGMFQVLVAQ